MAGIYEGNQVLKKEEVGDVIFIAQSDKVPFSRLLKRGKKPENMLFSYPVQKYPDRGFGGTLDGTDISTFNHTNRDLIESVAMWMMTEGWMASRLANLTRTHGVKNEEAKQAADDGLILAQMIEKQLLSDLDIRVESGANSWRSRGAFQWLNSDAQATKPVPEDYRPNEDCIYTGTLANFHPSEMEDMLTAAATAKKEAVNLTGYVGIQLKARMSSWAQKSVGIADTEQATMIYQTGAKDKKLQHVVDFFEFDAGKVHVFPSWYLLHTEATGEATAASPMSGLFLDMDMWELRFTDAPSAFTLPPQTGGPRGCHDTVYGLACLNPTGQCAAQIGS